VDSARIAAQEFRDIPIHVIDTETLSMGQGLIVIAAAQAVAAGKSAQEIVHLTETLVRKTYVLFTVENAGISKARWAHRGGYGTAWFGAEDPACPAHPGWSRRTA